MTDEHAHAATTRSKTRSASICAASLEAIPPPADGGVAVGTPQARRRRPAARSQSARLTNSRSVKRRTSVAAASSAGTATGSRTHYSSEPRLAEQQETTPDISPHIRRKGSAGAARRGASVHHRKSTAFLDVPEHRGSGGNNATSPAEEDEDSYRLRSFSFTSKGIVNRGDSFRRRRSRSNSICPPGVGGGGGGGGTAPSPIIDEPNQNQLDIARYVVALLGSQGVGKNALISQFLTSECINAYDRQKDIQGEQSVCIMLNGEESELTFLSLGSVKDMDKYNPPDAFVILYSVVDKASFLRAESDLTRLQDADLLRSRPAILVANKIDLARSRAISTQDGKCLACTFRAKFTEISVGINHNVDELLVGILTQIRLKVLNVEDRDHQQWYKSRGMIKASMKARQMFTWLFGREDSKFKNCENLHIL